MSKLTLLSGKVKSLKIQRMTKSVFTSSNPQKLAEAGVLTAAALGSVYASTIMASSRLKMTQEVEVFSCEVNGVKLVGCFGEVTFMSNHNLEFVVEYINDEKTEAVAHAARNTKRKVIWVSPLQDKGDVASRKSNNGFVLFLSIFSIVGILFFVLIDFFTGEGDFSFLYLWRSLGFSLIVIGINALIIKFFSRIDVKDAKRAAEIFKVFGYQYPAEVNLSNNCFEVRFSEKEKTGVLANMPQWVYRYRDSDLSGGLE